MKNKISLILVLLLIFSTCSTSSKSLYKVNEYKYDKANENSKYMVELDSYTTGGSVYHKKYLNYLFGIAKVLREEKQISIKERSIGFYYDDNLSKSNFYLGVDVQCDNNYVSENKTYEENGRVMMKAYLKNVLDVIDSAEKIFEEKNIEGVVIGLFWQESGRKKYINVWARKNDFKKYLNGKLTLRGFVFKCTVTDYDGRIIRLTF